MKNLYSLLIGIAVSQVITTVSYSAEVDEANFRCSRLKSVELAEVKEALLAYCDLNRPFTLSSSEQIASTPNYLYCCHKKKKD